MCLGSQTRFKASASAKCSGALWCLYIYSKYARSGVSFGFSHAARSRSPARVCAVCTSLYGTSRFGGFPPPRLFGSLGSRRDDDEVGIVQRLFTIQRAVAGSGFPFSCPFYRSRPGGPEAVHGAVPGGSRTRSPQQSAITRSRLEGRAPQHRARYSAY